MRKKELNEKSFQDIQTRYSVTPRGFSITNGRRSFNRPIYGNNSAFMLFAGDLPQVMMSLPGRGGILSFGVISSRASKWLHEFDNIISTYEPGIMHYIIRDSTLSEMQIELDVVTSVESDAMVMRIIIGNLTYPLDLVWTFGGAAPIHGAPATGNPDPNGYVDELDMLFHPGHCVGNNVELNSDSFSLRAQTTGDRPIYGECSYQGEFSIHNPKTFTLGPKFFMSSKAMLGQPLLAHKARVEVGNFEGDIVIDRPLKGDSPLSASKGARLFTATCKRRREIASQITVSTPDDHLNLAVKSMCIAMDALWDAPTFMHGVVAWHCPLLGWRSMYGGDAFGWHDRVRTSVKTYAATQMQEPETALPKPDPETRLTQQAMDSIMHTRGRIWSQPNSDSSLYNMQEVFIDEALYHYLWTGDEEYAREIFPVIKNHLNWEKRCFDPDNDGLYENYANTHISDAHWYNGGACTQASAVTFRANMMAAQIARRLGEDDTPFRTEAEKIKEAVDRVLWLKEQGHYAEYKDLLGNQLLHTSAELPTIYHPIDFYMTDMFQSYQLLRYTEYALERVPVTGGGEIIWSSNWMPWIWSVRMIGSNEAMNTAIAYYRIGQVDEAYKLIKGTMIHHMYDSKTPGALNCISYLDSHMSGNGTDFADSVSMFCRAIVEGLFGILPQMQNNEITIMPGFPSDWQEASIHTPDISYDYQRDGDTEVIVISTPSSVAKIVKLIAKKDVIKEVRLDGNVVQPEFEPGIGVSYIVLRVPASTKTEVLVTYSAAAVPEFGFYPIGAAGEPYRVMASGYHKDPQDIFTDSQINDEQFVGTVAADKDGHHTFFLKVKHGNLVDWQPVDFEIRQPIDIVDAFLIAQEDKYTFRLRNNTPDRMSLQIESRLNEENQRASVEIPGFETSQKMFFNIEDMSKLSPGTNIFEVDIQGDRSATITGSMVDWDLISNAPKLRDTIKKRQQPTPIDDTFNDNLTDIFKHEYLSPRSPYCSLQIATDGHAHWCYPNQPAPDIDDSLLRDSVNSEGIFMTDAGILFKQAPRDGGKNVDFVSCWDNFPDSVTIPIGQKASKLYLLVAGSTNPMQSHVVNARATVVYDDGTSTSLDLINPLNYRSLEVAYVSDVDSFCVPGLGPHLVRLGNVHAQLLDIVLEDKIAKELFFECMANEVVVGLLGVTILM